MLDPSHLLDKLSCFRSNDDPFPALRSPLYQPKPPVPLMGFESNLFLPVIVESSLQRQQEEEEEEVVIATTTTTTTTTTTKKNSSNPRRRKPIRNDRHSKIYTAQGLRDRRMRLSLEVARKFFALQDMLGFDKASTTVDWLITQSKSSIEQHVVNLSKGSSSSPMDRFSVKKAKEEGKKVGSSSSSSRRKVSLQQLLSKGARAEARARARERTKEKKKEKEKEKENFGGQSEEYYLYGKLLPFVISGESSNQNIYNNNYIIGAVMIA